MNFCFPAIAGVRLQACSSSPLSSIRTGGEENRAVNNNSNLECGFVSFWHTTMEISVGFKMWKRLVNEAG